MAALDPAVARRPPPDTASAATSQRAAVTSNAVPAVPCDDTAEIPDTAMTLADEFSQRAELLMLAQQSHQQELQARLDRMKADFNAAQETRSETMREMNALRDMAVEQEKKDDEILKKFIAMI